MPSGPYPAGYELLAPHWSVPLAVRCADSAGDWWVAVGKEEIMSETKLSYSEAIRLGSMLKPQGFGLMRDRTVTACANDAAGLAVNAGTVDGEALVADHFKIATLKSPVCPECARETCWGYSTSVAGTVAHLNDSHRWTRERIADWVESIERMAEVAERAIVISPMEIVQLMEAK